MNFVCPRCSRDSLWVEVSYGFVPAVLLKCFACFWWGGEVRLSILVNDIESEINRLIAGYVPVQVSNQEPPVPPQDSSFAAQHGFVRVPGLPGLSVLVTNEGLSQKQVTELAARALAMPRADRPLLPEEWRAFYRESKATLPSAAVNA